MRKHIIVGALVCGDIAMTPFLPLWVWAMATGILGTAAFFLYKDDLPKMMRGGLAKIGLVDEDSIARKTLKMAEEKQRRRQAELILAEYIEDPDERIRVLEQLAERHATEDRGDD